MKEVNIDFQRLKDNYLQKIEFKKDGQIVMLTFRSVVNDKANILKLINCLAFKDLGIFDFPIEAVLIRKPGHFFREYCNKKGIDFNLYYQLEILPKGFIKKDGDEVEYRTFFALFENIEFLSSIDGEEDFWW